MPAEQDVSIYSGNDALLQLTVNDESGNPIDLSGALALIWALAKTARAAVPLVEKTLGAGVTIIDAVNGRADITVDAEDIEPLSGTYYHEVRLTNIAGKKVTVTFGTVTIPVNLIRD